MTAYLTLVEPKNRKVSTIKKPFGLYSDGSPTWDIIRLICGTVDIRENQSGSLVKARNNFIRPDTLIRSSNPQKILDMLYNSAWSCDEFAEYLKAYKSKNREFLTELKEELILVIYNYKRKNYVGSFLHFYRLLESFSIAFPLIYAAMETDFKRAHRFLIDLIVNEKSGELSAFKQFVPKIAQSGGFNNSTFDIDLSNHSPIFASELCNQFSSCIADKVKNIEISESKDEIKIKFNDMSSFVVTFRNRLFHKKNGEPHFNVNKLGGAEECCRLVLEIGIWWFALIFSEIVKLQAMKKI